MSYPGGGRPGRTSQMNGQGYQQQQQGPEFQQQYQAPPNGYQQQYQPPPTGYQQQYQPPPTGYQPQFQPPPTGYQQQYQPPPTGFNQAYQQPPTGYNQMQWQNPQSFQSQGPVSTCTGRKKALLIGINYRGQRGELRGCINDVTNVKNFLVKYRNWPDNQDFVVLTEDQPNPLFQPTKVCFFLILGEYHECSSMAYCGKHSGRFIVLSLFWSWRTGRR